MSDDHLRATIVRNLILVLLAAVVLFLIYGLIKGNGDNDAAEAPSIPAPAATTPKIPAVLGAQVGCQQPPNLTTTTPAKGRQTFPPNPGVRARGSGHSATISVTIPTSTQECRVAYIRVQLDSTTDKLAATTKNVSVLTGPPVRKVRVTLPSGAGVPQIARAFTLTADGRSSSGATVSVR